MLKIPKDRAIQLIKRQLNEIEFKIGGILSGEILSSSFETVSTSSGIDSDLHKWRRSTQGCISRIFGEDSEHYKELLSTEFFSGSPSGPKNKKGETFVADLQQAAGILGSMIEEIQNWSDEKQPFVARIENDSQSKKIFVVHGRDESTREAASGFLRELSLEPIILGEQASGGATIIEKFEQYADVGFALVLLTPDDAGSLQGEDINPRARQNVIFEMGFFVGCLGRKRVILLKTDEIEIPSDYTGVLYIELDDNGKWKKDLVRELKNAGCEVEESE